MITIQSQDKQLWEGNHIGNGYDKEKALIYCSGYVVGSYDTVMQRDYVLEQIALAIERGDKLYRMPSVEAVEKILDDIEKQERLTELRKTGTCTNCYYSVYGNPDIERIACNQCKRGGNKRYPGDTPGSNWQPKE